MSRWGVVDSEGFIFARVRKIGLGRLSRLRYEGTLLSTSQEIGNTVGLTGMPP